MQGRKDNDKRYAEQHASGKRKRVGQNRKRQLEKVAAARDEAHTVSATSVGQGVPAATVCGESRYSCLHSPADERCFTTGMDAERAALVATTAAREAAFTKAVHGLAFVDPKRIRLQQQENTAMYVVNVVLQPAMTPLCPRSACIKSMAWLL